IQERGGRDVDGIGPLAAHRFKSGIDLSAGVVVVDLNLQSHRASSRIDLFQLSLGGRDIGRIGEHSDAGSPRDQLTQEFQPLCRQLGSENIDSRHVAARTREACQDAKPHRVVPDEKDNGNRVVAALAANVGGRPAVAITATWRLTSSAASAGNRSSWFSAKRYTIATFSPS